MPLPKRKGSHYNYKEKQINMLNPALKRQPSLSQEDYIRYARQIIVQGMSTQGQERLKKARVICIGAGGLNTPALLYLVACGVGTVGIIDRDRVEMSNLQRQISYSTEKIGQQKVRAIYKSLKSLNPLASIKIYSEYLKSTNAAKILLSYDIVVDGTDTLQARYLISHYCYKLHKIHIYGAIEGFVGHISVFNYKNSFHYNNLHKKFTQRNNFNCNNNGILNSLAGIIGTMQATEAIKIITGIGSITNGHLLIFNALNFSLYKIKIRSRQRLKAITISIDKNDFEHELNQSIEKLNQAIGKEYQLIDIRTTAEFQLHKINTSINIPLEVLKTQKSIKRIKTISTQGYSIIIYCSNNTRSYIASQILNQHKIKHLILKREIE